MMPAPEAMVMVSRERYDQFLSDEAFNKAKGKKVKVITKGRG